MSKAYNKIDVNIFKEIQKKQYDLNSTNGSSNKRIQSIIQKLHSAQIVIKGFEINKHKELGKVKIEEHGFKDQLDIKFEFKQDVFEESTTLHLTPIRTYQLEDNQKLPTAYDARAKAYLVLLSDSFERLKIKVENVISETEDNDLIELYAKKNILMAHRILEDSKITLEKQQKTGVKSDVSLTYMFNVFLIKVIDFLQEMFSSFYKGKKIKKKKLKTELFDSIGMDIFIEPITGTQKCQTCTSENKDVSFQWNGQINVLVTLLYDLMNKKQSNNTMLLDASHENIKYLLNNYFVDKNGEPMNETTIDTYLKSYRDDKRAPDHKRINLDNYTS